MDFWGGGAPAGIGTAGFAALHYRGFWTANSNWLIQSGTGGALPLAGWFSFSGKGFIRVQKNGVDIFNNTDILNTRLNPFGHIESILIAPNPGDQFDIYYWQLGEDWGGLVGKFILQLPGQTSSTQIFDAQYREAPVLSASILPYSTATALTLSQVVDVTLENQGNLAQSTLKVKVPLSNISDGTGWVLLTKPRRLQFTDPITKTVSTLKRSQLIKFYGGFAGEQYPRFTGRIVNFNESGGFVTIECQDVSERMSKFNVENYPDFISYSTFGYFSGTDISKPVWSAPAYDNWPLEHAMKDLAYKGGIDPRLFYGVPQVNNANGTVTNVTDVFGSYVFTTRAKSISGSLLLLQRQARYGNIGGAFDSHKGPDDTYLYRGNATTSILDWSRELADTLGYDYRFDANGNMVLQSRANPSRFTKFITGTQMFSPTAILGSFQQNASETVTITGARIDLIVGRSPNTGVINFTVQNGATIVAQGSINTGDVNAATGGIFFYDQQLDVLGNNLCSFTLFEGQWGTYTVTVAGTGGGVFWFDCVFGWDRDPKTSLIDPLQTDLLIEDLSTQSNAQDSVNNVVIVGAIKSTLTDSQKAEQINNPEFEFYVSRAVDPSSIWDPNALNFVGGKVSTLIADKKISNQDYANWAAETLLIRQRDPGPSVRFRHTILPFLEPRDVLNLADISFRTITSGDTTWIQSYTETYQASEAISEIVLTAYAPIPSYEPQQSLPVSIIDSLFFGQPVINFTIFYPSIDAGFTVTNPGPNWDFGTTWGYAARSYMQTYESDFSAYVNDPTLGDFIDVSATSTTASGTGVWPPVPDSITLGLVSTFHAPVTPISPLIAIYKNNPYMKFTHIYDYTKQRIYVPCLAGDGTSNYSKNTTYPTGFGLNTGHITFQGLPVGVTLYNGASIFYDPYMSELPDGQLISIAFDILITGYYRVSIWDARNKSSPTQIAWLTNPTISDPDPESHWTYMTPERQATFQWDGVDTIGDWNGQQSDNYGWKARGWFEKDQKPNIGAGFYAWNDQTSPIQIISSQFDAVLTGKLAFNPDHYSIFYVKVECKNDDFIAKAQTNLDTTGLRTVNSNNLFGVAQGQNPQASMYIYTHLPQPTTINIANIEDWDFAGGGSYDPTQAFSTIHWLPSGDYAASLRNDKPIRITLQANPRPGNRFQNNRAYTTFKVNNVAHLNFNLLDQFMMFLGQTWNNTTSIEQKRLVSRRLTDDKETIIYADADFRTGDTLDLANTKWVFRPQDFTVTANGVTEALRYQDYLQLQDVPGFTQNRTVGQPWSRLIVAYMSYIFYLSTYIQDRSGRMTWAIDPTFIDKSKITQNVFTTTHPEELEDYSVRTIIARQWIDPNYVNTLTSQWGIPTTTTSGQGVSSAIQLFHNRLDINDNFTTDPITIDINGTAVNGLLTTGYLDVYSENVKDIAAFNRLQPRGASGGGSSEPYLTNRSLGAWNTATNNIIHYFGLWSWEGDYSSGIAQAYNSHFDPLWIPDLTRDFHPFFLTPPMPYELSKIPFWTDKTLPVYGPANIYPNYERYQYGQGTGDGNRAESDFDSWHCVGHPVNDTRPQYISSVLPNFVRGGTSGPPPLRDFLDIGQTVATWVDFTIPPNVTDGSAHHLYNTSFDYQRQNQWKFWEQYRGIFTIGGTGGNVNTVYVSPSGPYLMNDRRFDNLIRSARGPFNADTDLTTLPVGVPNTIDATLSNGGFIYVAQIRPYSAANHRDRSWFSWTFRRKYNWYSSSYFPVTPEFKLHPRYLYTKYSKTTVGNPPSFDAGAWVGWKDDGDPGTGLVWQDSIFESWPGSALLRVFGFPSSDDLQPSNIFTHGLPRMPLAIGPRLAESTDAMITLSLVNSRRKNPVPGL
jgi:hypothetical protein